MSMIRQHKFYQFLIDFTQELAITCTIFLVQRLKGDDYHLSEEFTGPTFSSSLFDVDFESGC